MSLIGNLESNQTGRIAITRWRSRPGGGEEAPRKGKGKPGTAHGGLLSLRFWRDQEAGKTAASSLSTAMRNSRVISGLAVTLSGCNSMTTSLF